MPIRFAPSAERHGISPERARYVVEHCLASLYSPEPEEEDEGSGVDGDVVAAYRHRCYRQPELRHAALDYWYEVLLRLQPRRLERLEQALDVGGAPGLDLGQQMAVQVERQPVRRVLATADGAVLWSS